MRIVILNDGATWTSIEGCVIATVPDDFDGSVSSLMRKHLATKSDTMPVYDGNTDIDNGGQVILYTGVDKDGKPIDA